MKILVTLGSEVSTTLCEEGVEIYHSRTRLKLQIREPGVRLLVTTLVDSGLDFSHVLRRHDRQGVMVFLVLEKLRQWDMLLYQAVGAEGVYMTSGRQLPIVSDSSGSLFEAARFAEGVILISRGETCEVAIPYLRRRVTLTGLGFSTLLALLRGIDSKLSHEELSFLKLLLKLGVLSSGQAKPSSFLAASELFDFYSRPQLEAAERPDVAFFGPRVGAVRMNYEESLMQGSIYDALRSRVSRRSALGNIPFEDLTLFFGFLLERRGNGMDEGRNFPAAGGFYDFHFYVASRALAQLGSSLFSVEKPDDESKIEFIPVPVSSSIMDRIFEEAGGAWGALNAPPSTLVLIAFDRERLAKKYGERAMRLMLMNSGALIQVMYLVAHSLGLSGCALGTGSRLSEALIQGPLKRRTLIAEFALGK